MKSLFLLLLSTLFLVSCSPEKVKTERKNFSPNITRRFLIQDKGTYKIIHVFGDKTNWDTTYSYVLYHKGTERPDVSFEAEFIETPVQRVACLSNIFVGCMAKLKEEHNIVAVDNINYICNETVTKNFAAGKVKEIAKNDELDVEATIMLKPEIIFTYGTGRKETDVNPRVKDAQIPVAVSVDHYETTPLARAEWLKFVAAFFEKDSIADTIFTETKHAYEELKKKTSNIKTRATVISEIKYNDTWYVPGGKSFMAQLMNDAGADYFWKNDTNSGSLALTYEQVYLKANSAEYWINVHEWNSMDDCVKQDERNKNFKAYQYKNIYNNNALNNGKEGNQYWENGLIAPHEILRDLIYIFNPSLLPGHQLKYYQRLQ